MAEEQEGSVGQDPVDDFFSAGVFAQIIDRASAPARKISSAVSDMLERLNNLKKEGKGTVEDVINQPFERASQVISRFKFHLAALGGALLSFYALRQTKRELTELFNEAVKLENVLVSLANLTGSDQFASNIEHWAKRSAIALRLPREEFFEIARGLQEISINAAMVDTRGILAAGLAGPGTSTILAQVIAASRDPAALRQLNEVLGFRLPFDRLQAIAQISPQDWEGRFRSLNQLLLTTFGDTLERTKNSTQGILTLWGELKLQIRETIMGDPRSRDSLFGFFRETLETMTSVVQRNLETLQSFGTSIGQILRAVFVAFRDFSSHILGSFGIDLDSITESGRRFRRDFLIPMTGQIIFWIDKVERFAETVFDKIKSFFGPDGIDILLSDAQKAIDAVSDFIFGQVARQLSRRLPEMAVLGGFLIAMTGNIPLGAGIMATGFLGLGLRAISGPQADPLAAVQSDVTSTLGTRGLVGPQPLDLVIPGTTNPELRPVLRPDGTTRPQVVEKTTEVHPVAVPLTMDPVLFDRWAQSVSETLEKTRQLRENR